MVSILAAIFLAASRDQTDETTPGSWLAMAAPSLRAALMPLIEHRRAEGFQVTVLESTTLLTPEHIRQTNAVLLQAHIRGFAMQADSPCQVLMVGGAAALGTSQLVCSLLHGVTTTDPITFAGVGILILVTSTLACWLAGRRAMRIEPREALRHD